MVRPTESESSIGWYEQRTPVRGCYLTLDDIRILYRELAEINTQFGKTLISSLKKDDETTEEEWLARSTALLKNAFALTVTINGKHDFKLNDEREDIFIRDDLPFPIKSIYFTNVTAWRRNANDEFPRNAFEVFLDFEKPPILDPSPLVSAPTPNQGHVTVQASDMTYFRAVQQVISAKLLSKKTRYAFLHKPFIYDLGMWALILPVSLIVSTYAVGRSILEDPDLEPYRWALLAYGTGLLLMAYRFLVGYTKWAFPVNVLAENKDTALKHRLAITTLVVSFVYKIAEVVFNAIIG